MMMIMITLTAIMLLPATALRLAHEENGSRIAASPEEDEVQRETDAQQRASKKWLDDGGGASGGGSTTASTVNTVRFISEVIAKYGIRSIIDAPCGDFNYMQNVLSRSNVTNYYGFDIGHDLIRKNSQKYGKQNILFQELNLVTTKPPVTADLAIVRELLFHIKPDLGKKVLENVLATGVRYLITTTHPSITKNESPRDKWGYGEDWGYYDVNVELEPFNLAPESVLEEVVEPHHMTPGVERKLRLYDLSMHRK